MLEYLKNKKILVVVAHPDDEVLGLGASMKKLINEYNCEIRVVILGEGLTSRTDSRDVEKWSLELKQHRSNIKKAQTCIGYQSLRIYDFPDNRFDSVALLDIVKVIEKDKKDFNPQIIFTHHGGDLNIDHQRTFESVITATRPMAHEKVETILTFETPSGTEWQANSALRLFLPNMYFEISKSELQSKIDAIESYDFEKRKFPHPRSPKALKVLAQRHGTVVGCEYAEAFQIIRNIQRI